MKLSLKMIVEKYSNIVYTSNIGYVWHALCTVYCWNKDVPGLSMVPYCHHYHLRYNLNRCIAQLGSCNNSNVQQTGLAKKDLPVVVLFTMALIATRYFHRVSSKNSCTDDLEIEAHTLKGICLWISSQKVCLRLVCKSVEALIKQLL